MGIFCWTNRDAEKPPVADFLNGKPDRFSTSLSSFTTRVFHEIPYNEYRFLWKIQSNPYYITIKSH